MGTASIAGRQHVKLHISIWASQTLPVLHGLRTSVLSRLVPVQKQWVGRRHDSTGGQLRGGQPCLGDVTAELLAQGKGGGILRVRAPDLYDVVKLLGLGSQRAVQGLQRWHHVVL